VLWSSASRASTSKRLHSVLLYKSFSNTQDIHPLVKERGLPPKRLTCPRGCGPGVMSWPP